MNAPNTPSAARVREVTLDQYLTELRAQSLPNEALAFRCPMCRTVQSAADLIEAGAGADFDAVERYLAYSCIGRFTGAREPRLTPDGKACNWTLGGLFSLHRLEVLTPDGQRHPRFEPATPEEAQAHAAARRAAAQTDAAAALQ